ncbi:MAG: cadherin repeat domain-containing protein, partial [Acidobacteriota bacterium]|nr:cadherin repeat domain-containing protein [Acidobacteriota bacterium]
VAPVLGAIGNKAGFWGNALSFTASATDADLPANTLTYSLAGAVPTGASITAAGAFTWTPTSAQLGTHTITVLVTDNGTPSLSDSETITVTVGRRPAALTYTGAVEGQYSDTVTLKAILTDNGGGSLQGQPVVGRTLAFALGTQAAAGVTAANGEAMAAVMLNQPSGVKSGSVAFGDAGDPLYLTSSLSLTNFFNLKKENVQTEYTGDQYVVTAGPNIGTANSVRLAAHLTQQDGESGDLMLARVRFELYKFNNSTTTPDQVVGNVAVNAAGDAETTAAVAVDDAWMVKVVVESANAYWTADPVISNTLTVVYGTTDRRVTGGGWVADAESANGKGNFGFTVNYSKNGSPKGNALYLFRKDGFDYRVKSNSWQGGGLTFYQDLWKASFSGKCNVQKINSQTGEVVESLGNYTFVVDLIDGDLRNPKETDRYAIQVLTDTGALWRQIGTRTNPLALGGGNVAVKSN